jgi:MYXO-CTERM domain-containing protein
MGQSCGMKHSRPGKAAVVVALVGSTALGALAFQSEARACGGLFCNAPPPDPFAPLPVAQNGENVVFAITKDPAGGAPTIDAHIQILYTGDVAKFSWVVPVEAMPTLSTGTDKLFSTLASLTQPQFNVQYETSGTCLPDPQVYPSAMGGGAFGTGTAGSTSGTAGAGGANGVSVSFQGAVGPYEAAVIKSDDPVALKMWLADNGYTVSDAAGALIDTYVRENKFFVALKLMNGLGVKAIQPIVLTFRGTEPCVPLRLTAIAANPDMPVLVWALSDKRVVPRGFYELQIDEARIDWWNGGSTYFGPKGLVSQAADEAGGNAFVAEYAGPSAIARAQVYANGQINLAALAASMTPPMYVQQLLAMGLGSDPLTLGLLAQFIPMPAAVKAMGITDSQFYGNLGTYWSQFVFPPFDLAGLTDAISMKIVTPRIDAQTMIDGHPYLTRLNTFLSPVEMNQDAFFFESQDLPDVPNVHSATIETVCGNMAYTACNAPQRLRLADGRTMWIRAGTTGTACNYTQYNVPGLTQLPAAQMAWQRDTTGDGMVVVDNIAKIQAGIDASNNTFPTEMTKFPMPVAGAGGAGIGGGTAGAGGGTAGAGGGGPHEKGSGGCGCNLGDGSSSGPTLALLGTLGVVLSLRRRRRACRRD